MGWRFVSWWRSEIQQPEAFIQSCFFSFWSVSPLVRHIAFTLQGSHWNSPKASPSMGNFHRDPTDLFMNGGESDPSDFNIWLQLFSARIFGLVHTLKPMPLCNGIILMYPVYRCLTSILYILDWAPGSAFEDSRWIWRSGSVARKAMALQLLEADSKVGSLTVWKFGV